MRCSRKRVAGSGVGLGLGLGTGDGDGLGDGLGLGLDGGAALGAGTAVLSIQASATLAVVLQASLAALQSKLKAIASRPSACLRGRGSGAAAWVLASAWI